MAYPKRYPAYEKSKPIPPDFLIQKWQNIAVLGSRLAMAIESNAPQEEIHKLAQQYNQLYAEAISRT